MMKRCAFLTMDSLQDFVCDDDLAIGPFRELGWTIDFVSWRETETDWNRFEAVVIRSTWDYQKEPQRFLEVLNQIDRSPAHLENSISLVRWNLRKSYLTDLEQKNVPIVPTLWLRGQDPQGTAQAFDTLRTDEIVFKPLVGANADHAFRVNRVALEETLPRLRESYQDRLFLAQPFRNAVVEEGEYSLFFFDGRHSHSILKTPRPGDFRSQEEHGSDVRPVDVEPLLLQRSQNAMDALPVVPLYARVDLVRNEENDFEVMEFELIEPALYFRMDPDAADNFARAFDQRMRGL